MNWLIFCLFMLQPRIFVLLRRCIFDSDDEVSFCRIMHFCEVHLNWYVILLTLYIVVSWSLCPQMCLCARAQASFN